jgi:C1A family cysteine protease
LNYVRASGITTTAAYPYVAKDQACKTTGGAYKISSYTNHTGCTALGNAINASPVSVCVDASNWSAYRSGIFNNCKTSINHAVLLVGVGADSSWKIKNSWGATWGESGFIRLTTGNTCGVCSVAGVTPVV